MSSVLLTGVPGFVGSRLLARLLDDRPDALVRCLVLRSEVPAARELLRGWDRDRRERVELVPGDITRVGLDLPGSLDADEVFHVAAVYDLDMTLETGRSVNVGGTRNVLDWAEARDVGRVHYVSTCYVSGRHPGPFAETDLDVGQRFNNAYEETKYEAEVAVREAIDRGVPATVYRLAAVVGDGRTGETPKYDGLYYVIRLLLKQGRRAFMPVVGRPEAHRVNIVPIDFVVRAMSELASLPDTVGKTYQLADGHPPTVDELLGLLEDATGRSLTRIPVPAGLARWTLQHVPFIRRWIGIPPGALGYFTHRAEYTVGALERDLPGVSAPPLADYLPTLVRFVERNPEV